MSKFHVRREEERDVEEVLNEFYVRRKRERDDNGFYVQGKRVSGGQGFANAMWRFNASPREYARRLGKRVTEKLGVSKSVQIFGSEEFFLVVKDDKPLIVKELNFVEQKRQESVFAFEKWLEEEIEALLN